MVEAFHEGGGAGKPLALKADVSYDTSYESALEGAYQQWRYALLGSPLIAELKTPELFDLAGGMVGEEQVKRSVMVSSRLDEFVDWVRELAELGFERIILHNVNSKQEQFIDAFGAEVLPKLRE